jgi:hypothetical protein
VTCEAVRVPLTALDRAKPERVAGQRRSLPRDRARGLGLRMRAPQG